MADNKTNEGEKSLNREEDYFQFKGNFHGKETIQYPLGLVDESDSYMTFFISVDARSTAATGKNTEDVAGEESRVGQNRIAKTLDGTSVKNAVDTAQSSDSVILSGIASGVKSVGGSLTDKNLLGSVGKKNKILKTSITLPMPINLSTNYTMQYQDDMFGAIDNALFTAQDGTQLKESAKNFGSSLSSIAARIAANVAANKVDVATSTGFGIQSSIGGVVARATGQVFNNRQEKMFAGVRTRSFGFEFQFAPRDQKECEVVRKIITTLKYHMHPELTADRIFYVVPSEFNIVFYFKGQENIWVNRISTCVLESMNIQYSPGGSWAALENGHPCLIYVSLQFGELETLTKERIVPNGSNEFEVGAGSTITKWKGGF
jgi:hypothetical protein